MRSGIRFAAMKRRHTARRRWLLCMKNIRHDQLPQLSDAEPLPSIWNNNSEISEFVTAFARASGS